VVPVTADPKMAFSGCEWVRRGDGGLAADDQAGSGGAHAPHAPPQPGHGALTLIKRSPVMSPPDESARLHRPVSSSAQRSAGTQYTRTQSHQRHAVVYSLAEMLIGLCGCHRSRRGWAPPLSTWAPRRDASLCPARRASPPMAGPAYSVCMSYFRLSSTETCYIVRHLPSTLLMAPTATHRLTAWVREYVNGSSAGGVFDL